MGKSKGGLSAKIHATTDALGNPTSSALTPGKAHDLDGADLQLSEIQAKIVIADKAFSAEDRIILPLKKAGKGIVIPSKSNAKELRDYDKHLYNSRHLIENFFCQVKKYRGIATRYDKTVRNFLSAIYLAASVI
nr:IS5 family transposase [Parachlamydia acanthamoebae]